MRLGKLVLWDIRLQIKSGFYFLYAVLTILYAVLILALPEAWRNYTSTILIFSDPAAMGLFFMGAIVLLEKSQMIHQAIAVSPITECEYVTSKVISLGLVSVMVALIIALVSNGNNILYVLIGTILASAIFTLLGIIISTKITSLNQFILYTVPIEIVCFVPAILYLFNVFPSWLQYYPPNACMDLISGHLPNIISFIFVIVVIAILFIIAVKCVKKMKDTSKGTKI